jgi:hypothetical protein
LHSVVTSNVVAGGFGVSSGGGIGGGIYVDNAAVVQLDEFTLAHLTGNTASTGGPDIAGLYALVPSILPGDFNHDATVDSADYVVWRNGLGTMYAQDDYDVWRARFGQTAGSGATTSANVSVLEPAALLTLVSAMVACLIANARQRYTLTHP